jgi:redox-sensitive bicupin YhaK (pirin superfamily)
MIQIRKNHDRGNSKIGWLNSYHTFSFSEYYDSKFMGFGNLRVINEDTVQAGYGFGKHPHSDMEIISYVIDGSLEHKDSMGTGSIIKPGDIQRMSAGTGVEHSEFNPSQTEAVHFLQIWIIPEKRGLAADYEQKAIARSSNKLILIGARDGRDGAVTIHQDVELYAAYLTQKAVIAYEFKPGRHGWLQLIKGSLDLNGELLSAGDGAAITDENKITMQCLQDAEFLLFDLGKS